MTCLRCASLNFIFHCLWVLKIVILIYRNVFFFFFVFIYFIDSTDKKQKLSIYLIFTYFVFKHLNNNLKKNIGRITRKILTYFYDLQWLAQIFFSSLKMSVLVIFKHDKTYFIGGPSLSGRR